MDAGAVLVTGAGVRVGRAIAIALGQAGWAVAVHYNSSKGQAHETAEAIRSAGGAAAVIGADLGDGRAVAGLIPAAAEALGRPLTALVNNASTFRDDRLTSMTRESWDHHAEINLRAPCFLTQGFAAALPEDMTGSVVNVIDQRVRKPAPTFFTYSLSKAALGWATVTMAQALAPRIRVNAVLPGPTLKNERQSAADWDKQVRATPLKIGSPPEEIAAAVIYLFSAQAVTGQLLAVDGGQHLIWQTPDIWGVKE